MSATRPKPIQTDGADSDTFPNPHPFRRTELVGLIAVPAILLVPGALMAISLAPAFSALRAPQDVVRLNALRQEAEAATAQAQTVSDAATRRRDSIAGEVSRLEKRLTELRDEMAGLEGNLEQAKKDLSDTTSRKASVEKELEDAREQVSRAASERKIRQSELARVNAQLGFAREALEGLEAERTRLAQQSVERLKNLTTITQQAEKRVQALRAELEKPPLTP